MPLELGSAIEAAAAANAETARQLDELRRTLPDVPIEAWRAFRDAADEELRCLEPLLELSREDGGNLPVAH